MILCRHAAGRFSTQEFDPPSLVDRTLPSRVKQLSVSGKKYPKIPAVDCDEQGFLAIYFVNNPCLQILLAWGQYFLHFIFVHG